jgi:hypothetical protein
VRQPIRARLLDVGDRDAVVGPVADALHNLVGGRVADNDANFGDAGITDGFNHPLQHGLIRQRHKLLGERIGQRIQACAFTAA